jgi:DNA replication protein DnaC
MSENATANPYEAKAHDGLAELGLSVAAEHLDGAAQRAAAERWSYSHFLDYLFDGELQDRHRRTVELNLKFARLPYHKWLEDFDFAAQPSIDRRVVEELATGRWRARRGTTTSWGSRSTRSSASSGR